MILTHGQDTVAPQIEPEIPITATRHGSDHPHLAIR
jgi:hypothetical protein